MMRSTGGEATMWGKITIEPRAPHTTGTASLEHR